MSMVESQHPFKDIRLFVLMGVAGCGKSTIAEELTKRLGGQFLDGDSFHPATNIAKMSAGTPLTDEDRWPWLETIGREMVSRSGKAVGACSALKRVYRETIRRAAGEAVLFIYLNGSRDLIESRMNARTGHFMPPSLLESQFATLEVPDDDELAISVDISGTADEIVAAIVCQLHS